MTSLPSATSGTVDPWPEILALLPQKTTFKGQAVQGDAASLRGFANWLIQQLPGVVGTGDPESKAGCLLLWLRDEKQPYEADEATRMAQRAAVQQAPANPVSDQTVPQVAQPPAPPAPPEGGEGDGTTMQCLECGAQLKNMTGMKRHMTMTHKLDWVAYCQKHGLDHKTGLRLGTPAPAPAQAAPAPQAAPPPPPPAAAVPPMFGAPGQATAPPSFTVPAPPPPPQPGTSFAPPVAPQVAPQAQAPQAHTIPFGQQTFIQPTMPAPPAQVASAPLIPMTGQAPAPFVPPQTTGPIVAYNPNQPAAPAPQAPTMVQAPMQPQMGAPTRDALAQMLGGPVDLIVVRLLDAAAINLNGRSDVNQLALLAEQRAKAEQKVMDLAQSAYGAGKQAAQRHFADLLTQNPQCYLLQNGYEPILPAGYLEILAARVTKFHIVTDSGRQTTTIF